MEQSSGKFGAVLGWVTAIWLTLSSLGDLVLLNVAAVSGGIGRPEVVEHLTTATWISGVLSAVLLLTAGIRTRRLDQSTLLTLVWGTIAAGIYAGLQTVSSSEMVASPTSIGAVPRLLLAGCALGVVIVLRSRAQRPSPETGDPAHE